MLTCLMVGMVAFGGPEVLSVRPCSLAAPGPNELRMGVKFVSLNPADSKRRRGQMRFLEPGSPSSDSPLGVGYDAAGIVEFVGSNVTMFNIGDRVAARKRTAGTYATAALVDADVAAKIPDGVSFEQAAALPTSAMTALQALRAGGIQASVGHWSGESVFVSGGAGGVGHYAVQLAKHYFKAKYVVTTCSTDKVEFCESLGADEVIDYTLYDKGAQYFDRGVFDVVVDTVGEARAMSVLATPGRKVVSVAVTDPAGAPDAHIAARALLKLMSIPNHVAAYKHRAEFQFVQLQPSSQDLALLLDLLDRKVIRSEVFIVLHGLEAAPYAFYEVELGCTTGKVVIEI